jgi:IS30 family transposase
MLSQAVMGTRYKQLTSQERDLIGIWLSKGHKITDIARRLGRSAATISREVRRNGPRIRRASYLPHIAQKRSEKRRHLSYSARTKMENDQLRTYVTKKLAMRWSPELISGRMLVDNFDLRISHEAIYQWIYTTGKEYIPFLSRKHRQRRKKGYARKCHKYNIPQRISIDERPDIINKRIEPGHWEVDTAFFHHCREVLLVMAERKTRYTMLTKLSDITMSYTRAAMLSRHRYTPKHLRKSFTYDNGRENVGHIIVNNDLGSQSYFCHPGRSWEKGTVENTIGIVRRILPKKAKFSGVSAQQLKIIEDWLNNRPRKCLGFKTPREAYWDERCTS